jgi:hypothetical protein
MNELKAIFIKASKTKENPKKDNASWTIVNLFVPGVNKDKANESEGAIIDVMSKNDPALFYLVHKCKFGDEVMLEEVHEFAGNRPVINYKIVSVQ